MISHAYWRLFLWKNRLWPEIHRLKQFQAERPDRARQELAARLLAQIRYFGKRDDAFPEWRSAAEITDADALWRQWAGLPIVTKRDLITRFAPHDMAARYGLKGKVNATGGSTGEPTHFFQDEDAISAQTAASVFCRLECGWKLGMPAIALWGSDRDLGKALPGSREQRKKRLRNDWAIDGFRVSPETVDRFMELLERLQPAAVFGYSSILDYAARELDMRGRSVPEGWVAAAWNGGEMLFDGQVELFGRVFRCPLHNLYGGREMSAMAYQPKVGGPLLVLRPHIFIEVVNEENKPASPGESGRLLVSALVGHGTPFLRYEVGDMAVADREHQDESGVRALRQLEGRNSGLLRLPNGTTINCIYWNHTFKEFPEIQQFQVVVRQQQNLEMRFTGPGFSGDSETRLRQMLNLVTTGIPVSITWMDRIPLTREGKLVQVVHE